MWLWCDYTVSAPPLPLFTIPKRLWKQIAEPQEQRLWNTSGIWWFICKLPSVWHFTLIYFSETWRKLWALALQAGTVHSLKHVIQCFHFTWFYISNSISVKIVRRPHCLILCSVLCILKEGSAHPQKSNSCWCKHRLSSSKKSWCRPFDSFSSADPIQSPKAESQSLLLLGLWFPTETQ